MATNDVYELTLKQVDRGQAAYNVFFYHQALSFVTTFPTVAQVLAEGWADQILPAIQLIQPEEVLTESIVVRNLFNESDRYELLISEGGTIPGDRQQFSTFNAVGFSLGGDNGAVKNGAKRFAGASEDNVNDGVITGGAFIASLDDLGDALEAAVTVGLIIMDPVFLPVIVKRVRSGSPGAYTYRLPGNPLEAVLSRVVVALWDVLITSQISRKIGVGV